MAQIFTRKPEISTLSQMFSAIKTLIQQENIMQQLKITVEEKLPDTYIYAKNNVMNYTSS